MPKILLLSICAAALLLISCERRDRPRPPGDRISFHEAADGVPMEYGRLVTATYNHRYAATLWFEQPDKTIIGVRVETAAGVVSKNVIRIPRN